MTPAARVAAAIDILDSYLSDLPLEKVLTGWARKNRYAGSGDRAAIRDLVFEAVRCRRSFAALGGAETGRGLMIGMHRARQQDVSTIFTGDKYAPAALEDHEIETPNLSHVSKTIQYDCPDWLLPKFEETLGDDTFSVLKKFQSRASIFLRVNTAKADSKSVMAALAAEDILTEQHTLSPTALKVLKNARRVALSAAYADGSVELQDAASQAVVDLLALTPDTSVLDFCAGGGGKSLAIAARGVKLITAHDALPERMKDLPTRAARAGADISIATPEQLSEKRFDLVVCDVPCSGSGSWRRSPDSKWSLKGERLTELTQLQSVILDTALKSVNKNGVLAYVTCSLFGCENDEQTEAFLARHPTWHLQTQHRISPMDGGGGFYLALLTRE